MYRKSFFARWRALVHNGDAYSQPNVSYSYYRKSWPVCLGDMNKVLWSRLSKEPTQSVNFNEAMCSLQGATMLTIWVWFWTMISSIFYDFIWLAVSLIKGRSWNLSLSSPLISKRLVLLVGSLSRFPYRFLPMLIRIFHQKSSKIISDHFKLDL